MTIKKLIIIHQSLPILNMQFLHLLLTMNNRFKETRSSINSRNQIPFDVQVFNLNITYINLPNITNTHVIDAYETAFAHEIGELVGESGTLSLHVLIEFFMRNHNFTAHGFYPGFADLLYNTILSDPRAFSDVWFVSVLLKIVSLGVTDRSFLDRIDRLIDDNIERFATNALIKLVILVLA